MKTRKHIFKYCRPNVISAQISKRIWLLSLVISWIEVLAYTNGLCFIGMGVRLRFNFFI